jgi:hypothetical protein
VTWSRTLLIRLSSMPVSSKLPASAPEVATDAPATVAEYENPRTPAFPQEPEPSLETIIPGFKKC